MTPHGLALILSAAGLAAVLPAQAQPKTSPPAPATTTPKGGLDLDRIKELENPKLTPVQRANLGLRLYRDEMVKPTPRPGPPYTDYKTHDYVLAQITQKLADTDADVPTLKKLWEGANPGEVKDSLTLFLGLKGQAEVKDPLAQYVLDRKHPMRLRELGVTALGTLASKLQDAKVADVLAQVAREDTQGQYKAGKDSSGKEQMLLVFPVRRAAVEAIKKLDKEGMLLPSYVTAAAERTPLEMPLQPRKPPVGPKK